MSMNDKLDIYVNDLFRVREACNAIKQKEIIWINNMIIGASNPGYIIYAALPPEKMMTVPLIPMRIIAANLSKLCNNITTEDHWSFADVGRVLPSYLRIQILTTWVDLTMSLNDNAYVAQCMETMRGFESVLAGKPEEPANELLRELATSNKDAGAIKVNPEPGYLMMIPVNALPLTKSDKCSMVYADLDQYSYVVRFKIFKKVYTVTVYMRFLKLPM